MYPDAKINSNVTILMFYRNKYNGSDAISKIFGQTLPPIIGISPHGNKQLLFLSSIDITVFKSVYAYK